MRPFEILLIIFGAISLFGSIFGVFLKLKLDITRVDMRVNAINRELLQREISTLLSEKINREDHMEIIKKIDHLITIYASK